MERHIHEAVKISTDGVINAKCEFRLNELKRLSVQLTPMQAEEAKAAKLDLEINSAIKNLVEKIKFK